MAIKYVTIEPPLSILGGSLKLNPDIEIHQLTQSKTIDVGAVRFNVGLQIKPSALYLNVPLVFNGGNAEGIVEFPIGLQVKFNNANISRWTPFPFQGDSDYWAAVNALMDTKGKVTVYKDGTYYISYSIPLEASTILGATTQWSTRLMRYNKDTGPWIVKSNTWPTVTTTSSASTVSGGTAQDSAIVELEIGDIVWVEVRVDCSEQVANIPIGGHRSLFSGTRKE